MESKATSEFYFVGNNLALDFLNSATTEINTEDLARWALGAGIIAEDKVDGLRESLKEDEVGHVVDFREQLRGMVEKLVSGRDISDSEMESINKVLRHARRFAELDRGADGFVKKIEIEVASAGDLLVPIAESFVDLLCYGKLEYLRKCERPDCILYFYDTTKNHRRRWCSMAVCGNRAKASKFYRKRKEDIKA